MATQLLPNNDKDLQLARRIGRYLEGEQELDTDQDEFLKELVQYKYETDQRSATLSEVEVDSKTIWNQIDQETKRAEKNAPVYHMGRSKSKTIWATAAAILIAAFIGIYYYTSQQPTMIATSTQQITTVTLDDGTLVTLRPHSSIYALSKNSNEQAYQLEGEAYFEVTPDPQRTFSVQAGNGKVSVLGTKFDLSTWGGKTQVYLEEGSIRFENINTNTAVTLSPGEAAETGPENAINPVRSDVSEFTDWMDQELIFKNKPVSYVLHELEQEFNFTFIAPDSILNTKLSGGLSLENAQQSLDDLSLVLDGTFVKDAENRYKFVPNQ